MYHVYGGHHVRGHYDGAHDTLHPLCSMCAVKFFIVRQSNRTVMVQFQISIYKASHDITIFSA